MNRKYGSIIGELLRTMSSVPQNENLDPWPPFFLLNTLVFSIRGGEGGILNANLFLTEPFVKGNSEKYISLDDVLGTNS